MAAANQLRRDVMLIAWDFFRADKAEGFASALRRAWAWTKKSAKAVARIASQYRAGVRTIQFGTMTRRADRRHIGNDAARRQAQFGA